jgi:hypothetical protein
MNLIVGIHIAGGLTGLVAGAVAVAARKGGPLHASAGTWFFASMLVMAGIGAALAPTLPSTQGDPRYFDSLAGAFTFYLVATGWATVRRKAGTIGRFEAGAFASGAALAAVAFALGAQAAAAPAGKIGGYGPGNYFVIGSIVALAAALDLKVVLRGGISGVPRIARHLWRMCLAFFVASGSLFFGQQDVMPQAVRGSPVLTVLGLAPLGLMVFWLVRVRFSRMIGRLMPAVPAAATSGGSKRS